MSFHSFNFGYISHFSSTEFTKPKKRKKINTSQEHLCLTNLYGKSCTILSCQNLNWQTCDQWREDKALNTQVYVMILNMANVFCNKRLITIFVVLLSIDAILYNRKQMSIFLCMLSLSTICCITYIIIYILLFI